MHVHACTKQNAYTTADIQSGLQLEQLLPDGWG